MRSLLGSAAGGRVHCGRHATLGTPMTGLELPFYPALQSDQIEIDISRHDNTKHIPRQTDPTTERTTVLTTANDEALVRKVNEPSPLII
jgi:hypothetical protein